MIKLLIKFTLLLVSINTYSSCTAFPEDNFWNAPIDQLPVHIKSKMWIHAIGGQKHIHPEFGSGKYKGEPIGIPINYITDKTLKYPIFFEYESESDIAEYPIPNFVKIEGGYLSTGDRHIILLDKENCKLYELFNAKRRSDGQWTAGSGAIFDLKSNNLRPEGWTSADDAGLPIYPGLVRYNEVESGKINHALRFTAGKTKREFIWPATHFASRSNNAELPPLGIRLRLKKHIDISGFSYQSKIIAQALKTYGMILADNGSPWFITGEPNENWSNWWQLRDLKKLMGDDFEVVNSELLKFQANSAIVITNLTEQQKSKLLEKKQQVNLINNYKKSKKKVKKINFKNKAKLINSFFVTPQGLDSNNGSLSTPWKTIQHAADLVVAGDTIFVKKGVYAPFKIKKKSGTKEKPIKFISDQATIDGGLSSNRDGIEINKAHYIEIRGFAVKYAKRSGITALQSNHINIINNHSTENGVWGIFTGFSNNLLINNNIASYSKKQHGIYVSNTSKDHIISNNKVFGNAASGIQLNADRHMGGIGIISNAKIYNNIIHNNGKAGGGAFNLDGVQHSKIYNNLLYDNRGTGLALFKGDAADGSKYNEIYNNTIVMPKDGRWCAIFKKGSSHNTFMNNVCINQHKLRGAFSTDHSSVIGLKSDFNVLTGRFTYDDGDTIFDETQWQEETGNDFNSIYIESPSELFDYELKNFIPYKNSPLTNAANIKLFSSHDIIEKKRKIIPDIGAYESFY